MKIELTKDELELIKMNLSLYDVYHQYKTDINERNKKLIAKINKIESEEIPDFMDAVDIMKHVEKISIERTNKMRGEVGKLFANLISEKYPELKVEYNLVWKDMNDATMEELGNKIKEKMEEN